MEVGSEGLVFAEGEPELSIGMVKSSPNLCARENGEGGSVLPGT